MRLPSLTKKQKRITGVLSVILVLLLIGGNIIAYRYKKIIEKALPQAVADATDSLYHISVKRVSINLLNRRITLHDVNIWADTAIINQQKKDSTAKPNYYKMSIPKLQVSGIMWDKLTGGEGYSCGTFILRRPQISIYKTNKALTVRNVKQHNVTREFSAGKIQVNNAKITYIFGSIDEIKKLNISNLRIKLLNWSYDNKSLSDSTRFLLSDNGEIEAGQISYEPPHSFYRFSVQNIKYNSNDNKLTANDLKMKLKVSEEVFLSSHEEQKEIYDIHFPNIELNNLDRLKLSRDKELHISDIYLNHSKIRISLNRLLPENTKSKMGRFPNQLLQKMKLPLDIRKITINNASVTYTETSEKTNKQASIIFDKLNGNVTNITNIPTYLETDNNCIARFNCKLNGNTDVSTIFNLSLTDKQGAFAMNMDIAGLQGRQLTQQTKAFALLEVRALNMKNMTMELTGNELSAKSNFVMLYNNLSIKMLTDENKLLKDKKKKRFISFIANNMILYSANPMPGTQPRRINTYVERDEMKSFFNLIWQNILYGVRETTIRDMEIIRWLQKNEKEKKENNRERKLKEILKRDKRKARHTSK